MKKIIALVALSSIIACTEKPKSTENTVVKTDTIPVSASIRTVQDSLSSDSLVVLVDSTGIIRVGNQKIKLENLETKLVDSLKVFKKKYGKLPDTILCRTKGDVLMGTRGAIKDAILDAQEKAEKN